MFNPLKPNGNYMSHLLQQSITFHFINSDISLNSVNKMFFVMVKCGVFFAVRTEFLNIILTSFGFKGLIHMGTKDFCGKQINPNNL
jgi:hypothetical protein